MKEKFTLEEQAQILDAGSKYLASIDEVIKDENDYQTLLSGIEEYETENFGIDHDNFQVGRDGHYHAVESATKQDDEPRMFERV